MSGPDRGLERGRWPRFWLLPVVFVAALAVWTAVLFLIGPLGGIPSPTVGRPVADFWFVFPLGFGLFWLAVLVVVRPWCWAWGGGRGWGWAERSEAEETVRIRFARGEITQAEMAGRLRYLDETSRPRESS